MSATCVAQTNRTIWFLGNSVSRIHYFAALALLNGDAAASIDEQVTLCGRGGAWGGRRPGQGSAACAQAIAGLGLRHRGQEGEGEGGLHCRPWSRTQHFSHEVADGRARHERKDGL